MNDSKLSCNLIFEGLLTFFFFETIKQSAQPLQTISWDSKHTFTDAHKGTRDGAERLKQAHKSQLGFKIYFYFRKTQTA